MLKVRVGWACCGYGDLFMCLPEIERIGKINLVLPENYAECGIPALLDVLVPEATYRFAPFREVAAIIVQDLPGNLMESRKRDRRTSGTTIENTCLSPVSIARVTPIPGAEDFIVVHPRSLGTARLYHRWDEVDFSGINYTVVGAWDDQVGSLKPPFDGDFLAVARLLRSSRGVLCVDSAILNLANALRVPSVAIYPGPQWTKSVPTLGVPLVNPSPEEVSDLACQLFCGEITAKIKGKCV